jgi:hypothetical protein
VPSDARKKAEQVIADITYRAAVKARQLPTLEAWLDEAGEGSRKSGAAGAS